MANPFTMNDLRLARKTGRRVAMLTCYDYTTARLLEAAGVQILLVGDSASNVILGHSSTLPITLDFLIELTAAVKRGAPNTLVMGDLPFGSYQSAGPTAIDNACEMIKRSGCDAIKVEVSEYHLDLVRALSQAGVAVVAHLGLRPQAVGLMGGYKFQGRTVDEANHIVKQAAAFAHAGAAAVLLEAVPGEVGRKVVDEIDVPVIGCGAGPACHAHVVVLQDLLRQTDRQPKFVPHIELSASLTDTAAGYVKLVETGAYPAAAHGYSMPDDQRRLFLRDTASV
ncbi:MAG TPA: 3-methyl-2-oxobutanoate hydroxymethyltransferase [Tepidisphaeraceae bacterium]|jgi:3-methyl-2-oxobutanoate hydroxymethyltransferase